MKAKCCRYFKQQQTKICKGKNAIFAFYYIVLQLTGGFYLYKIVKTSLLKVIKYHANLTRKLVFDFPPL